MMVNLPKSGKWRLSTMFLFRKKNKEFEDIRHEPTGWPYLGDWCRKCQEPYIDKGSLICQNCGYDNTKNLRKIEELDDKARMEYNKNTKIVNEGIHYCSTCLRWFENKDEYQKHQYLHEPREVCRCGHIKIFHNSKEGDTSCTDCLCPEYAYEQTLTAKQARQLHIKIELERPKDFAQ